MLQANNINDDDNILIRRSIRHMPYRRRYLGLSQIEIKRETDIISFLNLALHFALILPMSAFKWAFSWSLLNIFSNVLSIRVINHSPILNNEINLLLKIEELILLLMRIYGKPFDFEKIIYENYYDY